MESTSWQIDSVLSVLGTLLWAGILVDLALLYLTPKWMARLAFVPCGLDRRLTLPRAGNVCFRLQEKLAGDGYVGSWEPTRGVATVRSAFRLNGYHFLGRVDVQSVDGPEDADAYRGSARPPRQLQVRARWLPVPFSLVLFCLVWAVGMLPDAPLMILLPFVVAGLPTAVGYSRVRRALAEIVEQVEASVAAHHNATNTAASAA